MFYLQTKDGEKFFTNINSNDKSEFAKILENKLGDDAAAIFNDIVEEHSEEALSVLKSIRDNLESAINDLDSALNSEEIDRVRLEEILSDMQSVYQDIDELT